MVLAWQCLVAFIWGGLMALERKAFLQAMFSRPLVAATVMGIFFISIILEEWRYVRRRQAQYILTKR